MHSSYISVRNNFILVSGTPRTYVTDYKISISIYVNYKFTAGILSLSDTCINCT